MSEAHLKKVVEPLYRVDENVNSGTGLGLHIVRTLVADHDGRLDLTSGRDGTSVRVTLPVSTGAVVPRTVPQPPPAEVGSSAAVASGE